MKKYKFYRIDILNCFYLTVIALLLIYIVTGTGFVFGSWIDWISQHTVIPDYFRQQFYETGDLIPQFNLHVGAGQNIFNFSYYGYLNPVILISYALPWVSMVNYIMYSSIVIALISVYLIYGFVRSHGYNRRTAFMSALIFLCAGPLIYHSHKQIMFVQYMPFLIMAFFGVDRIIKSGRKCLLIFSIFLMIMTSYYFSISGIIAVGVYVLYCKIKRDEGFVFKSLLHSVIRYAKCVFTSIFMAAIILIPTFAALLNGRGKNTADAVSVIDLLLPELPTDCLVYSAYGIGMTGIFIIALVYNLLAKKKHDIFLATIILLLGNFPIFLYILNCGLYVNPKVTIPFLPLAVLMIAEFLNNMKKITIKKYFLILPVVLILTIKEKSGTEAILGLCLMLDISLMLLLIYVYQKKKKFNYFAIPVACYLILYAGGFSYYSSALAVSEVDTLYDDNKLALINDVLENDDEFYRTNDFSDIIDSTNLVYNNNYYQTSIYSSVYNSYYLDLCLSTLSNCNPTNNALTIVNSNDILFQTLMGVKYIISDDDKSIPVGYKLAKEQGDFGIYKNDSVYSLGFATSDVMSEKEFNHLSVADKKIALLKYIVTDQQLPDTYDIDIVKHKGKYPISDNKHDDKDDFHHFKPYGSEKFNINLQSNPDEILIIEADVLKYEERKVELSVNGVNNALSSKGCHSPNNNFHFTYTISSPEVMNDLDLKLTADECYLSDISVSSISYNAIKGLKDNVDMMKDIDVSKPNIIKGSIDVTNNGYFTTTIPYDKNFTVYVDGVETDTEITDTAFLGFKIDKGHHDIEIKYSNPYFNAGMIVSGAGLVFLFMLMACDFRKYRKTK